jgi:CCR4-NOT transcription complex subunit 2
MSSQRGLRPESYPEQQQNQAQIQQVQQQQQQGGLISGDGQESSTTGQSAEQPSLSQLSELDRFGLAGLLRMIHSENPDIASLAVGQDLMTLGLDLNQPECVSIGICCTFFRLTNLLFIGLFIYPLLPLLSLQCRLCP